MTTATWDDQYHVKPERSLEKARLALPAALLVLAFLMPPETSVSIGSLRLSPYRIILLILVVPSLLHILSGKAGRLNGIDLAMLAHSIWCVIALGAYGGVSQALESGGIYFVECFGAYAMGRRYIRNVADFRALSIFIALVVCGLAAVAVPESLSHSHFTRETFRSILGGPALVPIEPRMGLARAYGSFEHPILFGVFCSMAFATAWFVARPSLPGIRGWFLIGCIVIASFVSLSAGAWMMLGMQIALIGWDWVTKGLPGRWGVLMGLIALVLVVVSLLSNRSPVQVFISYASFSPASSYNRILIWHYGTAEVGRHPLLGIGLGEWVRAPWMSTSMDNFWLVIAVRYGLPALIFIVIGILLIVFKSTAQRSATAEWNRSRMAWITTVLGAAIAACTVHLWNNTFGFFMFIVGAGAWLIDPAPSSAPQHRSDIDDLEPEEEYDDDDTYR
jgi:hypothetical protein